MLYTNSEAFKQFVLYTDAMDVNKEQYRLRRFDAKEAMKMLPHLKIPSLIHY